MLERYFDKQEMEYDRGTKFFCNFEALMHKIV